MNRQTKAQTLYRRRRVEELLANGLESSVKIAERLATEGIKVSDRTVREDIALIEKEWKASIVQMRHVRQMRKVTSAEKRNAELWAEWERSKKDRERSRSKETSAMPMLTEGGKAANQEPAKVENETTVEGRLADPSYLTEIRRNDEHIAKLLGLHEPQRHAVGGDPDAPPIVIKAEPAPEALKPYADAFRDFITSVAAGASSGAILPDGAAKPMDSTQADT